MSAHRNFTIRAAPLRYARSLSIVHWCVAAGVLSCFATVEIKKRQPKGSEYIGPLMKYHKSFGLLVAGMVAARVVLRVATRKPAHLEGPKVLHVLADAGHIALYGFMIFMPASGIAMGYYGGKGLPFFWTKIDGAETPNKDIAKKAYLTHKKVGKFFEMMVGLHVAGAGLHILKSQNPLSRISPFAGAAVTMAADDDDEWEEEDLFVKVQSPQMMEQQNKEEATERTDERDDAELESV